MGDFPILECQKKSRGSAFLLFHPVLPLLSPTPSALGCVSSAAVLVLVVALCPLFHVETWSSQASGRDGICIPLLINVFFFCTYY